MKIVKKVFNAFKHVGAGENVNFYTLARNGLPFYLNKNALAKSPLTVFLSVNSICNLKCKMCDIGQKNINSSFYKNLAVDNPGDSLPFEKVEELIKELALFNPLPRISVTTTEPLLYKDIFRVARCAKKHGMEFQMTTNGALLGKYLQEIVDSGIDEVGVSIDGLGALHDEIRGKKGLYDDIKSSLEDLHKLKRNKGKDQPLVTLATVVSNFNYDCVSDMYLDLDDKLYDRAIYTHMNFIDDNMVTSHNKMFSNVGVAESAGLPGDTNNFKVNTDKLWDDILKIKRYAPKVHFAPDYSKNELHTFYHEPDKFVWENTCYIPWFVTEILANGDVIPMTRCIHIKMGNIYNDSFEKIWNGENYRKFRKALQQNRRFPICRRCRGIL